MYGKKLLKSMARVFTSLHQDWHLKNKSLLQLQSSQVKHTPQDAINPLSPGIHIQILQTDLHTLPLRISWENLIKHQGIFSFVIIFYILTTLSLDNVWTLLGENCCRSLLGLKGLMNLLFKSMNPLVVIVVVDVRFISVFLHA